MEVKPFKAFRFNKAVVGDVGGCISPPYDVISEDQQKKLYDKSKYNIVRIIKAKTTPKDNENDNQYTRAAGYLNRWIQEGALKQDSDEGIYAYIQNFQISTNSFERSSFIALAKLEEFGKSVFPHEQTFDEPKADRLSLEKAVAAKFGLVFMLYNDEKGIADKILKQAADRNPLIDFVDEQNTRHRLFAITQSRDIEAISEMMIDKRCIIADGHHRYETGLAYSRENPNPATKYQMMAFTNGCNDGLVVLATHRLIGNLEKFDIKKLLAGLEKNFEITKYHFGSIGLKEKAKQKMLAQMKQEYQNDKNSFGIYAGGDCFYVAALKDKQAMDSYAEQKSETWRSLDVSVLHKLILENLLGIGEEKLAGGRYVEYAKDTSNAINESISKVEQGQKQAAFFMNPPKIEQIRKVAEGGEKMPQKSTFFYPKVYTGLTVNKF